jgi:hypothetical protein
MNGNCLSVILLSVIMTAAGCGKAGHPKFPVSGEVTFNGSPVTEGMITFYRADDGAHAAMIDGSGNFIVDPGLREGQYRVYIEPPPHVMTPPPAGGPPRDKPKTYPNFPEKYRQASTSGLLATVEPDSAGNVFDFDMKP